MDAIQRRVFEDSLERAFVFERVGRARAILELRDVEPTFDTCEMLLGTEGILLQPIRMIGLYRSRLIALKRDPKFDRDYAIKIAQVGINFAEELGFTRHREELLGLASEMGFVRNLSIRADP